MAGNRSDATGKLKAPRGGAYFRDVIAFCVKFWCSIELKLRARCLDFLSDLSPNILSVVEEDLDWNLDYLFQYCRTLQIADSTIAYSAHSYTKNVDVQKRPKKRKPKPPKFPKHRFSIGFSFLRFWFPSHRSRWEENQNLRFQKPLKNLF